MTSSAHPVPPYCSSTRNRLSSTPQKARRGMGLGRMIGRRGAWQLMAGRAVLRYGRQAWGRLEPLEQAQLRRLLVQSRGRLGGLSPADRTELRRLLTKMRGRHS